MITRSIKMALKKIHEMCEESICRGCKGCPFELKLGRCFFDSDMYGVSPSPDMWDFDLLKGEDE